jgi:hypothetical protein
MIDPQRILADQQRRHAVDHGRGNLRGAIAFAPAGHTVAGLDLDHHRGPRVVPRAGIGERLRKR